MIPIWRPILNGNYRVKRGDVLTLYGEDPSNVFAGLADHGFVIRGDSDTTAILIWNEYDEDQEPVIWTKTNSIGGKVRLAMNNVFSQPLPLP